MWAPFVITPKRLLSYHLSNWQHLRKCDIRQNCKTLCKQCIFMKFSNQHTPYRLQKGKDWENLSTSFSFGISLWWFWSAISEPDIAEDSIVNKRLDRFWNVWPSADLIGSWRGSWSLFSITLMAILFGPDAPSYRQKPEGLFRLLGLGKAHQLDNFSFWCLGISWY